MTLGQISRNYTCFLRTLKGQSLMQPLGRFSRIVLDRIITGDRVADSQTRRQQRTVTHYRGGAMCIVTSSTHFVLAQTGCHNIES